MANERMPWETRETLHGHVVMDADGRHIALTWENEQLAERIVTLPILENFLDTVVSNCVTMVARGELTMDQVIKITGLEKDLIVSYGQLEVN